MKHKVTHRSIKFSGEEMTHEMPAEIDFKQWQPVCGGVKEWRKYFACKKQYVKLSPELRNFFPDDRSVNDALRMLVELANGTAKKQRTA